MHFPSLSHTFRVRSRLLTLICLIFPAWQVQAYDESTLASIEKVVQSAESYLGTPHRMGGTSRAGIDCSGLVYVSFLAVNQTLPRVSREQARVGNPVGRQDLRRGDLVFFAQNGRVFHVGLVLESAAGDVLFIHSSSSRGVIQSRLSEAYWQRHYTGARRLWREPVKADKPLAHRPPAGHISALDTSGTGDRPGRFPQASQRVLSAQELRTLGKKQLFLMRNEIFARHGYVFENAALRKHFGKQKWYRQLPKVRDQQLVAQRLSAIERANIGLIRQLEGK